MEDFYHWQLWQVLDLICCRPRKITLDEAARRCDEIDRRETFAMQAAFARP